MTDIQDYARAILSSDEGRKANAYKDTKGILTAGVGRNLQHKKFSEEEIDLMLKTDMDEAIDYLENHTWWADLNGPRKIVLMSMYHQFGVNRLLKFRKFLAALKADDYDRAAVEMLDSKWATQDTPARANRLAYTMRTGLFSPHYKDCLTDACLAVQTF